MSLVDRFTPSHLRLLTLWNDPPAWFASHGLTPPEAGMAGSRTQTVEAGLAEMKGRKDFCLLIARNWLSRDAYGQPVGECLRRIADGPAHDGFRQAVREVHQRPGVSSGAHLAAG